MPEPRLTLDQVAAACRRLAERILGSGWTPDAIVAVARGGLTPAHWLAHHLDCRQVTAIDTGYAGPDRTAIVLRSYPVFAVYPRRLLVVEDATASGRLLEYAAGVFDVAGRDVRTAALYRSRTGLPVDYAAELVDEVPAMPWEVAR